MSRHAYILRELAIRPGRPANAAMSGQCSCQSDTMGWNPTEESFNQFANRSDEVILNPPYPEEGGQIIDMGDAGLIWMAERRVKKCGLGSYPKNGRTGRRCREALRTWARRQGKNQRSRKQTQQLAFGTAGVERSESRNGKTIGGFIDPSSNVNLSRDPSAPLPVFGLAQNIKMPTTEPATINVDAFRSLQPTLAWDYDAPEEGGRALAGRRRIFGLSPTTLALYGAGVVGLFAAIYYFTQR